MQTAGFGGCYQLTQLYLKAISIHPTSSTLFRDSWKAFPTNTDHLRSTWHSSVCVRDFCG